MPIIKIISPEPQSYNLSPFGPPAVFEPGEVYNVADNVARGMMDPSRNWARIARDDEIPADLPQAADLPQQPVHATTPPEQAQSVEPPPAEPPNPASPAGRKSSRR